MKAMNAIIVGSTAVPGGGVKLVKAGAGAAASVGELGVPVAPVG
jgi:hypothetical protein